MRWPSETTAICAEIDLKERRSAIPNKLVDKREKDAGGSSQSPHAECDGRGGRIIGGGHRILSLRDYYQLSNLIFDSYCFALVGLIIEVLLRIKLS
uniref:Uncharacterized protein n=1 Tax=Rhizophora mucronata TaxID=61149 RepID=A0A2P2NRU1_RHIMU